MLSPERIGAEEGVFLSRIPARLAGLNRWSYQSVLSGGSGGTTNKSLPRDQTAPGSRCISKITASNASKIQLQSISLIN